MSGPASIKSERRHLDILFPPRWEDSRGRNARDVRNPQFFVMNQSFSFRDVGRHAAMSLAKASFTFVKCRPRME